MRIGNLEMQSDIMNAGGVARTVEDVEQLARTGLGAILVGSYTLDEKIGNSPNGECVYYHDNATGVTYNSMGMPNRGLRTVVEDLPEMIELAHRADKPLILNFAPISDDPASEVLQAFNILADAGIEELDGFELNASCPNVVTPDGGRHEILSHHHDKLAEVLIKMQWDGSRYLNIGSTIVRISPFNTALDAYGLVRVLRNTGVDAVSAFNTFPGGRPLDEEGNPILQVPGGIGGMSGSGMQRYAEKQTDWLWQAMKFTSSTDFEIIGSNGIHDAKSVKRRLELGASAVSVSTMFFEAQSSYQNTVNDVLVELAT